MAEITHRRKGELMRGLLKILSQSPDGLAGSVALERLAQAVPPTPYESGQYESGRRYDKIVRFTTVAIVKAGWMVKSNGIWSVTESGIAALNAIPDPEKFNQQSEKLYREWAKVQPEAPLEPEDSATPEAASIRASVTLDEAEGMARSAIEQFLSVMPPYEFQKLVGDLLRAMGYNTAWTAPPGKDGGTDLVAFTDPLGTQLPRIKVQVKRNLGSSKIDVDGLRSFLAVLGDNDVGLFVALSGFTRDAENEARNQPTRRVTLIDMERFINLWIEHHAKLDDAARRRFPLKPVWFLAGED